LSVFDWFRKLFSPAPPRPAAVELGRNEPCWCGSGKKYKKCHLTRDEREKAEAAVAARVAAAQSRQKVLSGGGPPAALRAERPKSPAERK